MQATPANKGTPTSQCNAKIIYSHDIRISPNIMYGLVLYNLPRRKLVIKMPPWQSVFFYYIVVHLCFVVAFADVISTSIWRRFNVHPTSPQHYGRSIDVIITLCAYRETNQSSSCFFFQRTGFSYSRTFNLLVLWFDFNQRTIPSWSQVRVVAGTRVIWLPCWVPCLDDPTLNSYLLYLYSVT